MQLSVNKKKKCEINTCVHTKSISNAMRCFTCLVCGEKLNALAIPVKLIIGKMFSGCSASVMSYEYKLITMKPPTCGMLSVSTLGAQIHSVAMEDHK
jgi:hypothetical protein